MLGGERGERGNETSSSKGGGESASGAGSTMLHFIDVVKQYPGQEQVDLRVEIEVPGTWFGGTSQGSLTQQEQREKYKAQTVEFSELREFPGSFCFSTKQKAQGTSYPLHLPGGRRR